MREGESKTVLVHYAFNHLGSEPDRGGVPARKTRASRGLLERSGFTYEAWHKAICNRRALAAPMFSTPPCVMTRRGQDCGKVAFLSFTEPVANLEADDASLLS